MTQEFIENITAKQKKQLIQRISNEYSHLEADNRFQQLCLLAAHRFKVSAV
jgi:hypothetical protein